MKQIIDRYKHSPIFWALIVFLFFLSYGLAGTLDRQDADARRRATTSYSQP